MTDRFTKLLLCAIALGLWANVMTAWMEPVLAQDTADVWVVLTGIQGEVSSMSSDLGRIQSGTCLNPTIC